MLGQLQYAAYKSTWQKCPVLHGLKQNPNVYQAYYGSTGSQQFSSSPDVLSGAVAVIRDLAIAILMLTCVSRHKMAAGQAQCRDSSASEQCATDMCVRYLGQRDALCRIHREHGLQQVARFQADVIWNSIGTA